MSTDIMMNDEYSDFYDYEPIRKKKKKFSYDDGDYTSPKSMKKQKKKKSRQNAKKQCKNYY